MFGLIIYAAAASLSACPGAVIDYRGHDEFDNPVPVREQVEAARALRECRKTNKKLPTTVSEFNRQKGAMDPEEQRQLVRDISPVKPWGEF